MPRAPDEADDLGAIFDRLGAPLYRYALMILGDSSAAEDAVQDVFMSWARKRPSKVQSIDAYLRLSVRNACYSQLRKPSRKLMVAADIELLEAATADARHEERLAIESALQRLPPEQREVVHLKVYEGLTLNEIALLTGESINTVAGRFRYALQKLRSELGPGERS